MDLDGAWYALPTTDQAAVLDALDLTDPVHAPLRTGFAPWQGTYPHDFSGGGGASHQGACWNEQAPLDYLGSHPEVFVTPALDGWTLVFCRNRTLGGTISVATARTRQRLYSRMGELSRRFGAAHWFEQFADTLYDELTGESTPTAWSQWCIARDGEIVMHCVSAEDVYVHRCEETDPVESLGELNAWMKTNEIGLGPASGDHARAEAYRALVYERHGDDRLPPEGEQAEEPDDYFPGALVAPEQDLVFGARAAAARLSWDPETLGPHTVVRGAGVLVVPRSLRHLVRRGSPPI